MNPNYSKIEIAEDKRSEFARLFEEFARTYPGTTGGQQHIEGYERGREDARRNYGAIIAAVDRGEDVSEQVLLKLLPHADSDSNRQKGAWICLAPAVTGDVKRWFERAGWAKPDDWPAIAEAILYFVRCCTGDPLELQAACEAFDDSPYSKGFQTGMLTPILNALSPDDFMLINSKSRRVINYFANRSYGQGLIEYPAMNASGRELVRELAELMHQFDVPPIQDQDLFDMFCHWLVAVKRFDFSAARYWKIAPGENAWNWDACREGGFIAIGWDQLGDISDLSRSEFNGRRDDLLTQHDGWTKSGTDQVWKFARIREGDHIVANRGTTEVLGIGRVVGSYYFVEGQSHGHRLPVEWDDVARRRVEEGGWRRTLIELGQEKFEDVSRPPEVDGPPTLPPPPERTFSGFSAQTFQFFADLSRNNNTVWFHENRAVFEHQVDNPLRALMEDVAKEPIIKLDPALETSISARTTISRINKNLFGRVEEGLYNEWYWGAFYRRERSRLTDAQLFVLLQANGVRVGLSFGKGAADVLETFRRNVRQNLDYIRSYVAENDLHSTYRFESIESGAAISTPLESGLEEGIPVWLEGVELNVVKHYDPETAILGGDGFVDEVNRVFSELYPIYLFAVSERPVQAVERYLARISPGPTPRRYTDDDFLEDTYLEVRFLEELKRVVEDKGQIIFVGPPGTGKTYVAQKFAKLLAEGDEARVELIQFHPSYEYEEFMEGIRPESKETGEGTQVVSYPVRAGAFKRFCEKARGSEDKWVMIIDEINRGNIAKIFGQLLYLLEYRDSKVVLPYSTQSFSIPSNVFILGTMNTADRSIALVDFALRRRFHFVHMSADRAVLERYLERNPGATGKALAYFDRANEAIDDPHYQIGFSYFMRPGLNESDIELIWRYSVFPYLQEYHFDDPDRLDQLTWEAVRDRVESRSGE